MIISWLGECTTPHLLSHTYFSPYKMLTCMCAWFQVGKTTLIKGIIRHYTRQAVGDVRGPVTLVAGKSRRLVLLECPQVRCAVLQQAELKAA